MTDHDAVDEQILTLRRNRVLGKMQMLSESPGASFVSTQRLKPKQTSRPPAGVRLDTPTVQGAPDKNRSLFDHYRYRFARAETYRERWLLCALAERDYQESVKGNRRPAREEREERDRRILAEYAGVPKLEAAVLERVSEPHLRKLRTEHGLDPEFGMELAAVAA